MWHVIDSALRRIGESRKQGLSEIAPELSASLELLGSMERQPYIAMGVLRQAGGNTGDLQALALIYSELRALRREVDDLRKMVDLKN